ncbi:MAG TPA: tetratricopeptide repeat protein, partial [Bacteroidia bacterium]|nr:tetratricopeptide repeat protein [Bacteroidia bacterium]
VCLVFFLFLMIFKAMAAVGYGTFKHITWFAGLGGLWHGIHPMHVESVSWAAERKDLLYTFFYLVGLMVYLKYINGEKIKWLIIVFILFVLSNLSKAMAVVFPLSLFALDFLLKRKIEWKLLYEKALFFLFSLVFGWYTFHIQKASGAVASFQTFNIFQRFMFTCYSFIMYIVKYFVPTHLCSFYPYPNTILILKDNHPLIVSVLAIIIPAIIPILFFRAGKKYLPFTIISAAIFIINGAFMVYYIMEKKEYLPFIFYISPMLAMLIPGALLYAAYRAGDNYFRAAAAGFGFYLFNVLLILQFVSVGATIMSERYSYVAYLGLIFMAVYFLYVLFEKVPASKNLIIGSAVIVSSIFGYLTIDRTKVWYNTKTLWQDVIKKYPHQVQTSYKNLGNFYADLGPTNPVYYDSAFANYDTLVKIHMADAGTYSNLANIYGLRKQFDSSLAAYNMALKLDSSSFDAHLDRGITYCMMKRYDLGMKDFDYVYKKQPNNEKLLQNRAGAYQSLNQYANAVADYNRLIELYPDNPMSYLDRGAMEWNMANYKDAMKDFTYYNKVEPNNGQCLFDIAVTYEKMNDYKNALSFALMAKNVKFNVGDDYIKNLQQKIDHSTK